MLEIGAGGGSIAKVDALGQIRVGPQSAGAEPGPAAYNLGGADATVTDANVQLGRLHPDTFGAKDISLSPGNAAQVLEDVAAPLGLDADTAALGITEVVDENMANAARVHAVENGKDLTGYSMVAFGGARPAARRPAHGQTRTSTKFSCPPAPPWAPPSGSCWRRSPTRRREASTRPPTTSTAEGANATARPNSTAEAETFVRRGTDAAVTVQRQVSMRYRGQGWEIPVVLTPGPHATRRTCCAPPSPTTYENLLRARH